MGYGYASILITRRASPVDSYSYRALVKLYARATDVIGCYLGLLVGAHFPSMLIHLYQSENFAGLWCRARHDELSSSRAPKKVSPPLKEKKPTSLILKVGKLICTSKKLFFFFLKLSPIFEH